MRRLLAVRPGYGGGVQVVTQPLPSPRSPSDVLVRVHCAAINPLDRAMARGYGAGLLELLRGVPPSFALGQEFSGVVEAVGEAVFHLRVGDRVWGAVDPWSRCGTLTDALYVHEADVGVHALPHHVAAAVPFPSLTVWRPVVQAARERGARTAVVFGRGAVGRAAATLLRSHADVPLVEVVGRQGLGARADGALFDVVVDASSNLGQPLAVEHLVAPGGLYCTFNGEWLSRVTSHGLLAGSWESLALLLDRKQLHATRNGSAYRWGVMRAGGGRLLTDLGGAIAAGRISLDDLALPVRVLEGGLDQAVQEWDHWDAGFKPVVRINT